MEQLQYETFLIYLRQCQNKIQKNFNEELKKYHISSTHLGILTLLNAHQDGYSMTELSKLMKADNALMTRNIQELEKIEYIYRDRMTNNDRKYHICLTKKGREVASEVRKIILRKQEEFKKSLTNEELLTIDKAMSILTEKFINKMKEEEKC